MISMNQQQVNAIKSVRLTRAEWKALPCYQYSEPTLGIGSTWHDPGRDRYNTPTRFPVRLFRFAGGPMGRQVDKHKAENEPWDCEGMYPCVGCFITCSDYAGEFYKLRRPVELLD